MLSAVPAMAGDSPRLVPLATTDAATLTMPATRVVERIDECESPCPCPTSSACEICPSPSRREKPAVRAPRIHVELSRPEVVHVRAPRREESCRASSACQECNHFPESERSGWPWSAAKIKNKYFGAAPFPGMVPVQQNTFQTTAFAAFPVTVQQTSFAALRSNESAGFAERGVRETDVAELGREVADIVRAELARAESAGRRREVATESSADLLKLKGEMADLSKRVEILERVLLDACEDIKKNKN
ncbi:MAG: hypothetical protein ACRC1K_19785 [Planctomycetia bacterium]